MPADVLSRRLKGRGRSSSTGAWARSWQRRGSDLSDPLWSARLLAEEPEAYRGNPPCLLSGRSPGGRRPPATRPRSRGSRLAELSRTRPPGLMRSSVDLAIEARRRYAEELADRDDLATAAAGLLAAASIGPYGAMLADGSEYSGDYGLTVAELRDFHRPRLEVLASTAADSLAFETVPSVDEGRALVELLEEQPQRGCLAQLHVSGRRTYPPRRAGRGGVRPGAQCAGHRRGRHQLHRAQVHRRACPAGGGPHRPADHRLPQRGRALGRDRPALVGRRARTRSDQLVIGARGRHHAGEEVLGRDAAASLALRKSTSPPSATSASGISALGSACASEPQMVPRLRVCMCPTQGSASATSGSVVAQAPATPAGRPGAHLRRRRRPRPAARSGEVPSAA